MTPPCLPRLHPDEATAASVAARRGGRGLSTPRTSTQEVYSDEEWEFISAVRKWVERTGHKYPTFADYLSILKSIGYRKPPPEQAS